MNSPRWTPKIQQYLKLKRLIVITVSNSYFFQDCLKLTIWLKALSRCSLNSNRHGAVTTSLLSLSHWLTTLFSEEEKMWKYSRWGKLIYKDFFFHVAHSLKTVTSEGHRERSPDKFISKFWLTWGPITILWLVWYFMVWYFKCGYFFLPFCAFCCYLGTVLVTNITFNSNN